MPYSKKDIYYWNNTSVSDWSKFEPSERDIVDSLYNFAKNIRENDGDIAKAESRIADLLIDVAKWRAELVAVQARKATNKEKYEICKADLIKLSKPKRQKKIQESSFSPNNESIEDQRD